MCDLLTFDIELMFAAFSSDLLTRLPFYLFVQVSPQVSVFISQSYLLWMGFMIYVFIGRQQHVNKFNSTKKRRTI